MQIAGTAHELGYADVQKIMTKKYGFTFMRVKFNSKFKMLNRPKNEAGSLLKTVPAITSIIMGGIYPSFRALYNLV